LRALPITEQDTGGQAASGARAERDALNQARHGNVRENHSQRVSNDAQPMMRLVGGFDDIFVEVRW